MNIDESIAPIIAPLRRIPIFKILLTIYLYYLKSYKNYNANQILRKTASYSFISLGMDGHMVSKQTIQPFDTFREKNH